MKKHLTLSATVARVVALFALFAALALALAGCGGGKDGDIVVDTSELDTQNLISYTDGCQSNISSELIKRANRMLGASYTSIPSWSGVQIENLADYDWDLATDLDETPAVSADDLEIISDAGFDFLLVPIDYRFIFADAELRGQVSGTALSNLDTLITDCISKGIHVCLCLENTPGGLQASGEARTLFTNADEQAKMIAFWELFAKRYAAIPSNALSFKLYANPPASVDDATYSAVMQKVLDAVHAVNVERLCFVDMLDGGTVPVQGLKDSAVAQSFSYYEPTSLTSANAVARGQSGSNSYSSDAAVAGKVGMAPAFISWPAPFVNGFIESTVGPYTIAADLPKGAQVSITISAVGKNGSLRVLADGKEIATRTLADPATNSVSYNQVITDDEALGTYGLCNVPITATIENGATELEIYAEGGCWVYVSRIVITDAKGNGILVLESEPLSAESPTLANSYISYDESKGTITNGGSLGALAYTAAGISTDLDVYADFAESAGVAVMMQGFGFNCRAPYEPGLAYLDNLLDSADTHRLAWCYGGYFGDYGFVDTGTGTFKRYDADYKKLSKTRLIAKDLYDLLASYQ